jgi:tetratricopeptide (TPR) repeat protein
MAQTVNYIIQRGDIYSTCGVVAALALYARLRHLRRTGLYLLPFVAAMLSKPPAIVFPVLLFAYLALFEAPEVRPLRFAALRAIPAAAVALALMALEAAMTPKTYAPSTLSTYSYCITQPFVLLRYFGSFFLPIHLNADTDLKAFSGLTANALWGFLFVAVLLASTWLFARHRSTKPIAFGLLWFLIASLPTSIYRLSEVENDHRMFMPFVGLVLAVSWAGYLCLTRLEARHGTRILQAASLGLLILLGGYAWGTHLRNRVWRTEESLWLDDVQKCPRNGRGLMNYGLTQMAQGRYLVARDYFQRALLYTPNYPALEINLGVVNDALGLEAEADRHFRRALLLAPADDQPHFYFGRALLQNGQFPEALAQLQIAFRLNPSRLDTRDLLIQAYADKGDLGAAQTLAQQTLGLAPGDAAAAAFLKKPHGPDANDWINISLRQCQQKNYMACLETARRARALQPNSPLAWNNIGAAYAGMEQWSPAIDAEKQALRLKPDFVVARNNLADDQRRQIPAASAPAARTPEDFLNLSLRLNQAGQYRASIAAAQAALRLRPGYAEAWNNIAAAYASLGQWDEAIKAAQQATCLKPDFQLARNNLAWALAEKQKAASR